MIDVEIDVFDRVYTKLIAEFPDAFVSGEYVRVPKSFPAVSIIEMSNVIYEPASALSDIEVAATIMYEVNVYSNLAVCKKTEAKDILSVIDNEFLAMGFIRQYSNPVPNLEDATIYRIVARYEKIQCK